MKIIDVKRNILKYLVIYDLNLTFSSFWCKLYPGLSLFLEPELEPVQKSFRESGENKERY